MRHFTLFLSLAAVLIHSQIGAAPLGMGFTYQGQLNTDGQPFNGTVTLHFSLWDEAGAGAPPTGGNMLGVSEIIADVPVVNGVFTVLLNDGNSFGPSAFNGNAQWLQIAICNAPDCATSTTLSPRQPLTGAPYALGPWNPLSGNVVYNGSGNVGIGSANPHHRLRISGGPFWTSNAWIGAVELDNANAIAWQTNAGGLHFGIGQTNGGLYFFRSSSEPGTTDFIAQYDMAITDGGRVGVGTISPDARLHSEGGGLTGVHGSSTGGFGVYGNSVSNHGVRAHSDNALGLYATTTTGGGGVLAEGPYIGIQGNSTGSDANRQAVRGDNLGSATGYAGLFFGTTWVAGNLIKNSGSFKIDHPLDPENKFLSHSFVESPDMMNIYNGNVTTGADGRAEIALPDYFEALNMDFRYQLTVIDGSGSDQFVQVKVASEVENNQFSIRSSAPNTKISWQVTGVRKDAWANAHRIIVEEDKAPAERGKFINPGVHGQPREKGLDITTGAPPIHPGSSNPTTRQ